MSRYTLDQYKGLSVYPKPRLGDLPTPATSNTVVYGNWESGLQYACGSHIAIVVNAILLWNF